MASETAQVAWVGDILKLLIPALMAWGASWLTNRRERRSHEEKQEAAQRELLVQQSDRLTAGWEGMTAQAREIIRTMQVETVEAKAETAACKAELIEVKRKYETALKELEALSVRMPARKRGPRLPP